MNKELIKALEEIQELFIYEDYLNAEIKVDELLEDLQKAKEQPTKNAEEFLNSIGFDYAHLPELFNNDDKSYYKITDLLEEFANQSKKTITEEEIKNEYLRRFQRIPNDNERFGCEDAFWQGAKWIIQKLK